MKYCVITLIFNNYDLVRDVYKDDNCDYFLLTDNKDLKSDVWNIIYLKEFDTDKLTRIQKTYIVKYTFYKYIKNFNQYDYFIQLDSSIQIKKSLNPIIQYVNDNNIDMTIGIHNYNLNILEEYNSWINIRNLDVKYKNIFIINTLDYDKSINGLCECTFKIYKNNPLCIKLLEDIHNIMTKCNNNEDANDQCYVTYIIYKYLDKIHIDFCTAELYRNSYFMQIYGHNSLDPNLYTVIYKYNKYLDIFNRNIRISTLDDYYKYI